MFSMTTAGSRTLAVALAALASTSAAAQTAASQHSGEQGATATGPSARVAETGDIVVTAQKRAERLQRVPLAVSAFQGSTLKDRGIVDITQVANLVPNVNVQQRLSYGVITIRGIGFDQLTVGAEAAVAVHQDGVYIARPTAALAGFYDVERLEIARGPQGTLFGRNSTGGAANIISRKPTETAEGYVTLGIGNYNAINVEAALGGPLAGEKLLFRIAAKLDDHDGYGKNIFNGKDIEDLNSRAVRGQLMVKPNDDISLLLEADYYRQRDSAFALHFGGFYVPCPAVAPGPLTCGTLVGGAVSPRLRDIDNDRQPENSREFYGATATLDWSLSNAIQLRSISAVRKGSTTFEADSDATSANLLYITRIERNTQYSQELQLIGTGNRLKWLLGGFYFNDKTIGVPAGSFGPTTGRGLYLQGGDIRTDAYAVFGQATYDLIEHFSLTVGGRYSYEKKTLSNEFFFPGLPTANPYLGLTRSIGFNSFTPKFGAEFKPSSTVLFYVNVQKGFKSGGYSVGSLTPPFQPETIWNYEVGIKKTFSRGHANLSAFHYDYSNVQVGRIENVASVISNAASANINGIEFEGDMRLTGGLRLDLTASYLDAKYANYTTRDPGRLALGILDLSGNRIPQAPEFSFNAGLQNSWSAFGGRLTLRGEAFHSSRVYFTPFDVGIMSQASYELYNAFLTFDRGHWNASLFVRNIANRTIKAGGYVSSGLFGFPANITLQPPRTAGFKIGYSF